jgi:hypothetical protein
MANKKIEIEVGVKTDQLDQATNKVGELKKLSNTISIQYDINGKPLDVVIDKSINLQKQVRILTAELRKTKEGTAEFKLLSTALGDTQDKLAQSNAKSRDLLGSLQLIPGPIGQIASQLNGAISVLKTFSTFSLKDIRFQFNETINDIKDIGKGFLGLNQTVNDNTQAVNTNTQAAAAATKSTDQLTNARTNAIDAFKKERQSMANLTEAQQKELYLSTQGLKGKEKTIAQQQFLAKVQDQTTASTNLQAVAVRGATIAWNAFKIALGGIVIAGAIFALTKLFEVLKEYITGAKAAEKENERLTGSFKALQNGIKGTEDIIKVQGQVALNEAKKRGASIEELTKLERKNLDDRVQANKDALKTIEKAQTELLLNTKINKEQEKERQKEIDDAIAQNSKQAGDLRLERILFESTAEVNISKKKQDDLMKDLDARIKLEIDKDITSYKALKELLDLKLSLRKKYEGLEGNSLKVAVAENTKTLNDALDEDTKRIEAFQSKVGQLEIDAIKDAQTRDESARTKKLNDDILALSYDKEFIKASTEEKNSIKTNLEIKYEEDILKIRDTYFQKQFKQQQDFQLLENEIYTRGKEIETEFNQQRLDDGIEFEQTYGDNFIFGTKNLRKMLEERFIDLRQVYNDEYTANEEQFRNDEETLKINLQNKKITQETYDTEIYNLGLKRIQNAQTNTQRQLQLDKLEVDSKRASADATIQIGQNLVGLLGAIAGKNIKLQKAAAILDAGVSIARVITDTSRAIIAFSASVAPLGPAGVPIAAGYAVKAKISAGLAIATIIASGIGKLKSIDENSLSDEGGGGQQSSSTTRGMARGGMIGGKRHAEGGTLIEAEKGEAVLTRGAVSMFGPMLSMMNQAGGGVSFNSNLMTTRQDNPILSNPSQDQAPIVVKTYVVEKDMVSQINKQARLKDLSTL